MAMNDCLALADFQHHYLGSLDEEQRRRIQAHLETCPQCRQRYEDFCKDEAFLAEVGPALHAKLNSAETRSLDSEERPAHFPRIEGYEISGVLGRGGMGVVYDAHQTKLKRRVALKLLPALAGAANPSMVKRFQQEATAAAKLHHTNLIPIYDYGESRDGYYYAMELIQGLTLSALIKRFAAANAPEVSATSLAALVTAPEGQSTLAVEPESESSQSASSDGSTSTAGKGRLYYRQAAKWMAEVADALHYAHCAGVIHRDVKPSNLIFSTDGRGVMVADFGLAKVVGDESVTLTGSLIGTYQYMSPEQVGAKRVRVDARTDIYSLGATLYELLAFKPAFKRAHTPEEREDLLGKILFKDPTPPRKIVPAVPIELQNICLKAMEKSPDSRYASAKELAEDLRRYIDDLPIVARSPSLVRRTTKFIRRHRTATAIALVIALAASAIGYFRHSAQQDQQRRVEALIAQGTSHLAGENWQSAEEVFGEVLDEDPGNLHALFNLAIAKKSLFYDSGEPSLLDEADALLTRSLEVAPGNARIWDFKGIILRNRGRLDDAVASHRKSLDFDDSPYSTWINLGLALALKGDLSSAEDALRRGVELCAAKCGPMPPRTLAAVQLQLDMPEASATIAQALEASGADVPSLLLRARLRLQDGEHFDVSGARDDALAADRLSHGADPLAKRLIGLAWISAEQWHDAIAAAKAALSLGDPPSPAHLILAIAYAHLGSADLAKQHYDTAVNHWPANLTERGDFVPRADGSVLWIESAEEWLQLRRQAEALIQAK